MAEHTDPSQELFKCPEMCVHFLGLDDETDDVLCRIGHVSKADDFRCFDNKCPDYLPDGVDMTGIAADILQTLKDHGRAMTTDEITTQVGLKRVARRSNN